MAITTHKQHKTIMILGKEKGVNALSFLFRIFLNELIYQYNLMFPYE